MNINKGNIKNNYQNRYYGVIYKFDKVVGVISKIISHYFNNNIFVMVILNWRQLMS